jgi:hypothetical protein
LGGGGLGPIYLSVWVLKISPTPDDRGQQFCPEAYIAIGDLDVTFQMIATFPFPFFHYLFLSPHFYISSSFSLCQFFLTI